MCESTAAQYPEYFCRGILHNIGEQHYYTSVDGNTKSERPFLRETIFQFTKPNPSRSDNFLELSINWVDDNGAIDLLMNCKKDTEVLYKGGVCKTSLSTLTECIANYSAALLLRIERQPLEDNKYHGNLLRSPDFRSEVFKLLAVNLAEKSVLLSNPNVEILSCESDA